jgi:N-acetylglutamate synthase-like GNAT family acetyltransferase
MPDGFVNALLESEFIVAEVDGSLAGFGFLNPLTREVEGIFVSPILHRHGVGSRLMRALQDRARALGVSKLWLNASLNAETFYSSLGFVVVQRTLWNHPNGFALLCVLMEKVLPTPSSRSTLSSAD